LRSTSGIATVLDPTVTDIPRALYRPVERSGEPGRPGHRLPSALVDAIEPNSVRGQTEGLDAVRRG